MCCDLTFRAFRAQNTNLEHLYIIEVLMHTYATIMFKDPDVHFNHNGAFTV